MQQICVGGWLRACLALLWLSATQTVCSISVHLYLKCLEYFCQDLLRPFHQLLPLHLSVLIRVTCSTLRFIRTNLIVGLLLQPCSVETLAFVFYLPPCHGPNLSSPPCNELQFSSQGCFV